MRAQAFFLASRAEWHRHIKMVRLKEVIHCLASNTIDVDSSVECNSYGLTMWEVKTKFTVGTLGPIRSGG